MIDENHDGTFPTDLKPAASNSEDDLRWTKVYFSWSVFGFYFLLVVFSSVATTILFIL